MYEVHSPTFQRIIPQIRTLAQNPRPSGCRKLPGSKNHWRIRIGDHRVLYEIDEELKAVRILRVQHRREVYRNHTNALSRREGVDWGGQAAAVKLPAYPALAGQGTFRSTS